MHESNFASKGCRLICFSWLPHLHTHNIQFYIYILVIYFLLFEKGLQGRPNYLENFHEAKGNKLYAVTRAIIRHG